MGVPMGVIIDLDRERMIRRLTEHSLGVNSSPLLYGELEKVMHKLYGRLTLSELRRHYELALFVKRIERRLAAKG